MRAVLLGWVLLAGGAGAATGAGTTPGDTGLPGGGTSTVDTDLIDTADTADSALVGDADTDSDTDADTDTDTDTDSGFYYTWDSATIPDGLDAGEEAGEPGGGPCAEGQSALAGVELLVIAGLLARRARRA